MMAMRNFVGLCVCFLLLSILAGQAGAEPAAEPDNEPAKEEKAALIIGLRSNVRPFSYALPKGVIDTDATRGPLGRAGYTGYMVRICDAALAEMLVDPKTSGLSPGEVRVYDIDKQALLEEGGTPEQAKDKSKQKPGAPSGQQTTAGPAEATKGDPVGKRFEDLGQKYDILCDPATMTNARRDMIVSPPVFLTGISYLSPKNQPAPADPCGSSGEPATATQTAQPQTETQAFKPEQAAPGGGGGPPGVDTDKNANKRTLFGFVAGTTSQDRGIKALINAREMPKFEEHMFAALRHDTDGAWACKNGTTLVRQYPNHMVAAQKFCENQEFYYYLGDLEIIRSYAEAIPGCKFDNGAVTYTNDRYAVFGRAIRGAAVNSDSSTGPSAGEVFSHTNSERELRVARFFSILTQKVIFNPSVLDKAYDDTFPGLPQSRKLKLFYWSIRGERLPEIQPDNKASAQVMQNDPAVQR